MEPTASKPMDYISTETLPYLGTSGSRVLRRAHLPLMRRGLRTALSLVFVEVMKEMPATLLLRPFGLDARAIVAAGILPVLLALRLSARR
jgi:hypothetical protein